MTIHEILSEFRDDSLNNRDLGDKFERLIAGYLTTDPQYAEMFGENVWLWQEWPGRGNKPDTGIDLVAEDKTSGEVWAIQCKFYLPEHTLQKGDIDSFFTASGKSPFTRRMIVSTSDKWSKHAEDAINNQTVPTVRLRVQDLDESPVDWSKFSLARMDRMTLKKQHEPRPHQKGAIADVLAGFKEHDRGKLIMACGTGKTFTALRLAEEVVPDNGTALVLVPSISLLSQTLREWTAQSQRHLHAYAICSDAKASKRLAEEDMSVVDLAFPAHTNPAKLVRQFKGLEQRKGALNVVFSTYQSIAVVADAQKRGLPQFDLVICDEAHRTTGVEQEDKDASAFVRIHDGAFIKAAKRLYMTATPRIYAESSKKKAKETEGVEVYSMDDEAHYGPEFHRLDFSKAVRQDLLTDYKVLVLAVDEGHVSDVFQTKLAKDKELNLDDATRMVGCYNALRKRFLSKDGDAGKPVSPEPMRRAVAFCDSIKKSQLFCRVFPEIADKYRDTDDALACDVEHVDGTFNALVRNQRLQWLRDEPEGDGNVCRLLSNARCLSEGVDVPALDAVLFMHPRKSVVDVVQSVGRVMRKAKGKHYGYIILPVTVPAGIKPEDALKDNERYRVVWQVLQALRAHDDRFNATVNKIELNKTPPDTVEIIGIGRGTGEGGDARTGEATQTTMEFPDIEAWRDAIYARIVLKCGSRVYWESWAGDIARIAERHIARLNTILKEPDTPHRKRFDRYLKGLRKNINPFIAEPDAIEMLAQHLITKPVFDALFEHYDFAGHNPVSKQIGAVAKALEGEGMEAERETLEGFYASVRERASGIDNAEGRQRIITELYDKFFKLAFPRMSERLGIVYTPVEVVDFIVRSAEWALQQEFKSGLTDKNVHILDPFTGTGTFMVRLLQSGLIKKKDLERKFREELHANELVLLAYYIAAINIEEAYHGQHEGDYEPFPGILLTDTFQLAEGEGAFDDIFPVNNERTRRQRKKQIRVIIGNPPYSAGQGSANDNNQNLKYPMLDESIRTSYVKASTSTNNNALYDSYIRSIRWATDRIGNSGIICYVTNGSFVDNNAMSGLRKCFGEEFSRVYCFNLRGNARTSGEQRRMEKDNVFGQGTRTPIAITLFIKNPAHTGPCEIRYHDIGDYLSRNRKLSIIEEFGSVGNVPWKNIEPNQQGDWINQRDPAFGKFMPIGDKATKGKPDSETVFVSYSRGVATGADAWCYNASRAKLEANMQRMIGFYNDQLATFQHSGQASAKDFVDYDPKKISWSRGLLSDTEKGKAGAFSQESV